MPSRLSPVSRSVDGPPRPGMVATSASGAPPAVCAEAVPRCGVGHPASGRRDHYSSGAEGCASGAPPCLPPCLPPVG